MGNNSVLSSLDNIIFDPSQHREGTLIEAMKAPFDDGKPVDIVYATLVETRLNITEWTQQFLDEHSDLCYRILCKNARKDGSHRTSSRARAFAERIGASYNGNLKALLAFKIHDLEEDTTASLFGRLTEARIAGIPVPNPKKAFIGRSLTAPSMGDREGIKMCFVSALFPMARLAACLESDDALLQCKIAFAKTLRRILLKASKRGLIDEQTMLIVQGDLNSRTVLQNGEAYDVLLELIDDSDIQAALIHELGLPVGRWHEPVPSTDALQLPVTYKFNEAPGNRVPLSSLSLGDILNQVAIPTIEPSSPSNSPKKSFKERKITGSGDTLETPGSTYRRTLTELGDSQLEKFGVAFKKGDFRPYRFPASADRVIYWCPDSLAQRISWQFPKGGYSVNYRQFGSDHRPVCLEAILSFGPATEITSMASCGSVRSSVTSESYLEIAFEDDENDSDEDIGCPSREGSVSTDASPSTAGRSFDSKNRTASFDSLPKNVYSSPKHADSTPTTNRQVSFDRLRLVHSYQDLSEAEASPTVGKGAVATKFDGVNDFCLR
jgi:hypothetical protein